MRDPSYDILFEPVKIGPVTAPNRFYAAPHATGHGWSQPNGSIGVRAMKAEGGWGVVSMQMTEIGPDSDMANHPMDRIWDEGDVTMHAAQVAAIHAHGALAAIELAHGGMRARNITTGIAPIGPSGLPVLRPEIPAQTRAMDLADIRTFRAAHQAAARRAVAAGYDILYVYAAHDLSILSHFLSIRTNQRSDAYGGSLENRVRLLREVLADTVEAAAGAAAVAIRFSVAEPDHPTGLRHDGEGRDVVAALAEAPDLWDVNLSGWPADSQTSRFSDEGFQLPFTDFVKSMTSKPVVGVGRFTSPDAMAAVVRQGRLDLIGAARPSIADPFLPAKIRDGLADEIRECIGCNICVAMDGYGVPIRCTQNPTIGEEWRRGWRPEGPIAGAKREVLIVGAGPAGLECTATLLRAGCKVTIADKAAEAGGRVTQEARLPGLAAWARVRDHRLQKITADPNAALYLASPMTADDVAGFGAEEIVIATGARWRADGVGSTRNRPEAFAAPVWTPDDVMAGAAADAPPGHALIYDDDHYYMASVLADRLAGLGWQVTFVTPLPSIAIWTEYTLEQDAILARLNALGVALCVNLKHQSGDRFVSTIDGEERRIAADRIIAVGARRPVDELYTALADRELTAGLHRIGDCLAAGTIQAAVLSGHMAARGILGDDLAFRRERAMLDPVVEARQ